MSTVLEAPHAATLVAPISSSRTNIIERSLIDKSCQIPVLFFYLSSIAWLVLGTVLGLICSWKMHHPEFLSSWGFTTFGRMAPAYWNVVAFGFASQAGIGTSIWLMARLSNVVLRSRWIILISGVLWNIGLTVGVVAILCGAGTSMPWMDFPPFAAGILFLAFAFLGIWMVQMFNERQPGHVYISQWYLLAAFFWFPWLYAAAHMLIFGVPMHGVMLALVNSWFAQGIVGYWFTPIALATIYYLIPKITGRPIYWYQLSGFGFWTFAFLVGWTGPGLLAGGPIPLWIQTVGAIANLLMLVPVITIGMNFHLTVAGRFSMLAYSPTLRFTMYGVYAFIAAYLLAAFSPILPVNAATQFSQAVIGQAHLMLYAFFAMVMFGSMYYIIPRLIGSEWRSTVLIKWHFWLSFYGIMILIAGLVFGGMGQGATMQNPRISFEQVVEGLMPYMAAVTLAGVVIAVAQFAFIINLVSMLLNIGRKGNDAMRFLQPERETSLEVSRI